jgi:diguanylate cyclase (GGDEF)-like protein
VVESDLAARLLASMPAFTVVIGDDLVIRHVSGNAPVHVGLTPDMIEGHHASEVKLGEDLEALVESAAYSLGHSGDVLGPVMFRFHNGVGGVCVAEAMSLNRLDDPEIRGLVVSIRDRCGLDLLDKALEALGAGSSVAVIAGLLLRAIELPPVVGSGWLVEVPPHAGTSGSGDDATLICASPAVEGHHATAIHPAMWSQALESGQTVEHGSLGSLPAEVADDLRSIDMASLIAIPIATPAPDAAQLCLIVANPFAEPFTINERHYLDRICSLLALASERSHFVRELRHAATHDPLTGLDNRASFLEALEKAGAEHAADQTMTLLYLDLDGFKPVNDALGHAAGDSALVEVAYRLMARRPPGARLARLGGDEFAIMLPDASGAEAAALADRLVTDLSVPIDMASGAVQIGVSIGIAQGAPAELTRLLEHADGAMYDAKAAGRGTWRMA